VPIFSGLKQAYLRTPTTPAGLGIAFEKAVKRNPQGMLYYLKIKVTATKI
jgi:citronellyl-CoA synthetase